MTAAALIKFTQGATIGADGQALFGITGTAVNVSNAANTGVASWEIELLWAPFASALALGVIASSNNGSAPAAAFTPDVRGAYRLRLRAWEGLNRSGDPKDTDIRCFGVKEANGFYAPAPQIWPRPLPPVASGEVGAKPDENNFAGQGNGWAGNGADGLLGSLIRTVAPGRQAALLQGLGLITETCSRMLGVSGQAGVDGTAYYMAVYLFAGETVSGLVVAIDGTVLASGVTLGKLGLYAADGTQLGITANQTTAWESAGLKDVSLVAPVPIATSGIYYASCISKWTVAGPRFITGNSTLTTDLVAALPVGAGKMPFASQTGQTDLPSPAVIALGTQPLPRWIGVR